VPKTERADGCWCGGWAFGSSLSDQDRFGSTNSKKVSQTCVAITRSAGGQRVTRGPIGAILRNRQDPAMGLDASASVTLRRHIGGEFDPGSGSTLAACLMHASRARTLSGVLRGGRVRNTWATCPGVGDSRGKPRVIPHTLLLRPGGARKTLRRRPWRGLRPIS
jgi:hypothetical protein